MRYARKDRTRVAVLVIVLLALWAFIGIKFALFNRQHRSHTAATPSGESSTAQSVPGGQLSPTLRLAALVAPVSPPGSDPFHPIIAPRSSEPGPAQPRTTGRRPSELEPAPAVLPPLPGSESSSRSGRDRLTLTGVILGAPSTAVLRLGDDHYVVKEGDVLNGSLRVQKITKTTITLREGRTSYTLRLGG